jgi:hypothetical protein
MSKMLSKDAALEASWDVLVDWKNLLLDDLHGYDEVWADS